MKLVIVESPTKAKTISKFLGKDYAVTSSYGHVRDLPRGKLGVDVEENFEPQYIIPRKVQKRVTALIKEAAKADDIILATDEDREGEAIAWHLMHALKVEPKKTKRIVFHEITKTAIETALKTPREINQNLVDAQQARRVVDRLVGYKLSPFLWKKIRGGLSAGRVQSVAVKLIVEREEEIKKFKPDEYWSITTLFDKESKEFEAVVSKIGDKVLDKLDIKNEKEAKGIVGDIKNSEISVYSVIKKETKRNPLPPFTTSTLQQTASQRLHFSAKQTMMFAQKLYEAGRITYMRTDSLNLSEESLTATKAWITSELGKEYAIAVPRTFKAKSKLAQEAHEAIRPTDPNKLPADIKDEKQRKLYELIWQRFIASQMPQAVFDATSVEILAKTDKNTYTLKANGNILRFDGYLKIWPSKITEKELPKLKASDPLDLKEIIPEQHFTEPKARYNEASLVKTLEEHGIGRPSTYAPIISVIQDRGYVEKNDARRFTPTETGVIVNKVLSEHFPNVVDVGFTAKMEEEFDVVAGGKRDWKSVVEQFYVPFNENLEKKYEEVKKEEFVEKTDEKCEKCGKGMLIKYGRFGKFMACSDYPECKTTKSLKAPPQEIGMKCPTCGDKGGEVIIRRTKRGKIFFGCNRYPDCDFASWTNPLEPQETKSPEAIARSSKAESREANPPKADAQGKKKTPRRQGSAGQEAAKDSKST